ncbi:hypothetical protein, partial [Hominenteromicrobium sp.]|uniref:hypothetical protein n=1 Tax=Hominenteromicrobium sp. TaxID=3073581 RepID=UPI003A8DD780
LHPEGVDRNKSAVALLGDRAVALHPEGVDRNAAHWSPDKRYSHVALHPEGVDRNGQWADNHVRRSGRPPHGGRG